MKFPVFDLHCDTALAMLGDDLSASGTLRSNQFHVDLERASRLDGYCQCFACFTSPLESYPSRISAIDIFERELAVVMRELNANQDMIRQVYSADEIESNLEACHMSAILTIEGPAGFGFDPALLENLYQIGFRISTLGWNEKNPLCGSHITGGGLTDLGREYVMEAQRLGMIIDVSHISDEAFWDIMDITTAPIIATHSNSRALCNVSRNLTDDMFMAICQSGGVAGLNLYPEFLGKNASIDTVCDHALHWLELDSEGKHIALGGDLDGFAGLPNGFDGIQDYSKLSERMLVRGIPEAAIYNIFWNNALGVIKKCCM